MADIQEQINTAKKAGYDDAAIVQHFLTMPEYQSKVKTALDANYSPREIISHLTIPSTPGTQTLPGGAVVMAPKPKYIKAPTPVDRVMTDIGAAGVTGGAFGAAAPQILSSVGAAATGSGLAPLQPVGTILSSMGRAAQATGPAARAITGAIGGLTGEIAGQAVESQEGSPMAAEAARFVGGAVGPDTARVMGKLALRVASSIIPGTHTERAATILAREISSKLQLEIGRPLSQSEEQYVANLTSKLRGAPKSEWEKIAETVGSEMERGAAAIRRAGESDAAFAIRIAETEAANIANRAAAKSAEYNANATRLQKEATESLNLAENAARAEIAAANASGIPRERAIEFTRSLKDDVLNKARATIKGVGDPNAQDTQIGTSLRNIVVKRNEALAGEASAAYKKTQEEVLAHVANLESKNVYVDSMPAYKALVADLRSQVIPGKHSPEVAAGYQKLLNQITGVEPKPLGVLAQSQRELAGAAPSAPVRVTYQAIDDARRMLGEAFRGQPAEGYAAIGETAMKKYYPLLSKVQKDYAGEKQAKLLDDYAASRPGLEIFVSKTGKKITGVDPRAKEQFLADPSSIPTTFFKTPTQFNHLIDMVGSRDIAVNAARDFVANRLASKQTSKEVESWMITDSVRDFLKAVPEVRNVVLQYKNNLAAAERTAATLDAGVNKLQAQITGIGTTAEKTAANIRAGGGVQYRELNKQAEQLTAQSQKIAAQAEAESKALLKNAQQEVGNITNKAAAAADLVYSRHSAMRNVRELIESGDMTRWAAVAPIIERSPEAQRGVYEATRQVVADTATSKMALQKYNETIRPALVRFNMLTTKQADDIGKDLAEIAAKQKVPEIEKLTLIRRLLLQGVAGYAASGSGRITGGVILPQPPNQLAPPIENALAR